MAIVAMMAVAASVYRLRRAVRAVTGRLSAPAGAPAPRRLPWGPAAGG
jgi:hypothetical protein